MKNIKQIIPAPPRVFAVHAPGGVFTSRNPVVAFALTEKGELKGVMATGKGLEFAEDFEGLSYVIKSR